VPTRESFGHAPAHLQVTDFHDIAEDQFRLFRLFLRVIAWLKTKVPGREKL
jgi:hypothetical protein